MKSQALKKKKAHGKGADLPPLERAKHMATKLIHREGKKVKAFILQRMVKQCRKLKEEAGQGGEGDDNEAVETCLEQIRKIKALSIDDVVKVVLRRLGVAYTGADHQDVADLAEDNELIKAVVSHAKMKALVQQLDDKFTALRREEAGVQPAKKKGKVAAKRPLGQTSSSSSGASTQTRHHQQPQHPRPLRYERRERAPPRYDKAVFIDSLSGVVPRATDKTQEGSKSDLDIYGPGDGGLIIRKNRPGQRARRQRAQALEAVMTNGSSQQQQWKGGGRQRPASNGGREGMNKKRGWEGAGGGDRSGSGDNKKRRQERPPPSQVHDGGNKIAPNPPIATTKASGSGGVGAETLHPSWAAKQAQKAKQGIVAFVGKKITFGDDDG